MAAATASSADLDTRLPDGGGAPPSDACGAPPPEEAAGAPGVPDGASEAGVAANVDVPGAFEGVAGGAPADAAFSLSFLERNGFGRVGKDSRLWGWGIGRKEEGGREGEGRRGGKLQLQEQTEGVLPKVK